ncbi:MAG: YggS family pyridoxal phosphate-dependent enzyme [Candidatus Hadarchaeum sp.]
MRLAREICDPEINLARRKRKTVNVAFPKERIEQNLKEVLGRIRRAALKAGRDPGEITLVAVTKGRPLEAVKALLEAGCRELGENRAQELVDKMERLNALLDGSIDPPPRWHFVGHLQRNKVNMVVGKVALIHSVDSLRLAQAISRRASAMEIVQEVLVQVNVSGEASKHGLRTEELEGFLDQAKSLPGISLRGLMTMAPVVRDPEEARPVFRELSRLLEWARKTFPDCPLDLLSMGMSQDFEVAVEEGANLVRIGTALFV